MRSRAESDDRVMEQQIKAPYPEVQPMNGYYRDKNQDANYFLKGHGISNMLRYSVVPSEQRTSFSYLGNVISGSPCFLEKMTNKLLFL